MTEHGSFYRKITYLVLIAVLLFPISQLGAPATVEDQGGRLAQLRAQHELGQSDLGDIDPASETIRLATLGLRGVAVSMLWNKANEFKKKEDWTNLRATLDQLSKLQPYFIKFWQYQAWNLTYNVSVELDDVGDRFHYVKRGIEFLKKGIKYNRASPYLLSELGWFIGNKIGKADEKKQYRKLFKADDDFHPEDRPPERRDNWLVSREWYETSIAAAENRPERLGQKNPVTFFSDPGRSQINYSEAIEEEGTFGRKAESAWATAQRLWKDYGNRSMKSTRGFNIRLSNLDRLVEENAELLKELESLVESVRESAIADKRKMLTPEERSLLDGPQSGLTDEQTNTLRQAKRKLDIQPADLAEQVAKQSPRKAAAASRLAKKIAANALRIRSITTSRDVVNYDYWATRCALEQLPESLKARELAYTARRVFKNDADLLEAKRLYEESFLLWAKALEAFPELELDSVTGSDIMEYIEQYTTVLEQLDLNLVDDEVGRQFPLWALVEANDMARKYAEGVSKFLRDEPPSSAKQSTPAAESNDVSPVEVTEEPTATENQ